jgi:hypothetical protein
MQKIDLLQKSIFAPLAPQFWGEPEFKVPQNWGASAVLGSPQVEHLAWMRGGIPGFMQEVYLKVPQNWGASAVLGSPQVEHLAWMRGGIPGFMQEV